MKAKFSIREKLYLTCNFEIECKSQEDLENALDEIGEHVSARVLERKLRERFGSDNVKSDGLDNTDNIEPDGEYEFWDWE